jgi:taurine dioxygenase
MTLAVTNLSDVIGAEITGVDLSRPLDGDTIAAIHAAWLEHLVLLFRDQDLQQEDMVRFTACFGEPAGRATPLGEQTPGQQDLHPNIMLISNIRENGEPIGALPDGELMFHHDMIHAEFPNKASLLYAREIPAQGGNTLFANSYAAYDALPDNLRASLDGRSAFHHYNYGSVQKGDGKGTQAFSESTHPVFRTHGETGRKAIYVNRLTTEHIVGMPPEDSDAMLARIYDHAESPPFVYEHVWRKGDLMLWDNRCSMHGRTDFPDGERRLMWRSTVKSDERPV